VTGVGVTFTPATPLPGSATVSVAVANNGVQDWAGNGAVSFSSSFTTRRRWTRSRRRWRQ
jgi:hypothetical protein